MIPAELFPTCGEVPAQPGDGADGLSPVVVPAVLWILPEQLGLKGEDVVEHPIDPPPLEPVVRDHAGVLEMAAERGPQRSIDSVLTSDLRFLEKLEASIERELLRLMSSQVHAVPSTSTRPDGVTRTWTLFSVGKA